MEFTRNITNMANTEEKKNILSKVQDYLDTEKGRVLLNYLYSWGAAVVILGALFKLTHIAGANLMLFIGMGTEVLVFFISGFERPFVPGKPGEEEEEEQTVGFAVKGNLPHGNIIINGTADSGNVMPADASMESSRNAVPTIIGGGQLNADDVEGATRNYIDQIQELTDKLMKISQHSELLERSTGEIDALGRNLVSLNKFYELHLRSVSSQMDNIDRVKEQTAEMVNKIEELNKAYARMVEALKVNSGIGSSER